MTDQDRAIYARMSRREQGAIDSLSPELRPAAIAMWARVAERPVRHHASTKMDPDRTTLDTSDDSEGRYP